MMPSAPPHVADENARLKAEIERLRRQIKEERQAANILLREVRAKVIEECAQAAQVAILKGLLGRSIVATIRALKSNASG